MTAEVSDTIEKFRRAIDLFIAAGRTHVPVSIEELRAVLDALVKAERRA